MSHLVKGRAHRNWWKPDDKNWHWLKCQGLFWSAKQLQFNLYLTRHSRSSKSITLGVMNEFPVYAVEERHEGIPRQRVLGLEQEMQQQNTGAVTWWLEVADGEATQVLLKLSAKGVTGEGMTNCELTGPRDHLWNHRGGIEDIPLPSAKGLLILSWSNSCRSWF